MKMNKLAFVMICSCWTASLPAFAQPGMVMPPPAFKAIDTHLQQTRTREQRDTIESKTPEPATQRQAAHKPSGVPVKKTVATKPKEAPSTIQDLDGEALFDRPVQIRSDNKSRGKPTK